MVNQKTLDLIAKYEGCVLIAYKDTGGVWTIGVGHTSDANLKVVPGLKITREKAMELLQIDVKEAEAAVDKLITIPLNENQRGALVSFTFNLGETELAKSTLRRKLNTGDYASVPAELNKWVYDNGKRLNGLIARRKAEGELWNAPVSLSAPASGVPAPVGQDNKQPQTEKTSLISLILKLLGF